MSYYRTALPIQLISVAVLECLGLQVCAAYLYFWKCATKWWESRNTECAYVNRIVSDYRLDDRGSNLGRGKASNLCIHTSSEIHPASCTMGTGGLFPGLNRCRGVTLTTHPRLVSRLRMSRSYTASSPPWRLHYLAGQLYFTFIFAYVIVKILKVKIRETIIV
jgi:hypothetical protein